MPPLTLDGTTGVSAVQTGAVESGDLFAGFANGITSVTEFRLTANLVGVDQIISSNIEKTDDPSSGSIGPDVIESSGVFTFPSTGVWIIIANASISSSGDPFSALATEVSVDGGSSFVERARSLDGNRQTASTGAQVSSTVIINVDNISNVQVLFRKASFESDTELFGNPDVNQTHFAFIRLGDAQ